MKTNEWPRQVARQQRLASLAMMSLLLVTSIIVSRSLFSFLPIDAGQLMVDLHKLAAYWAILLVGVHLGLNWTIVMNVVRSGLGMTAHDPKRALFVRAAAALIAVKGVQSTIEMAFGSKLLNVVTMDMWDFTAQTPQFFLNYLSIIGLFAAVSHYSIKLAPARQRISQPAPCQAR